MNFNLKKTLKKSLRRITKSDFIINLISSAIYWYARLVGKTTNWEIRGIDNFYREWDDNRGIILVAWHGRALMLPYFWNRKKPLNALVSLHRDGRMIAGLLEKFGLGTIGGSSNENASGAAVKLMHSLKDDTAICIIPDGPRGPRMHMGRSPLYYAQKTGKPIACISYSIANSFRITKSWDHMMIPLPFSRGICSVSEAMFIPADADKSELETYRLRLEEQLNRISRECDIKMGLLPDEPGICKKQTNENGQLQ